MNIIRLVNSINFYITVNTERLDNLRFCFHFGLATIHVILGLAKIDKIRDYRGPPQIN